MLLSIIILKADGASNIVCPACVIAGPPASDVCDPITNLEEGFAVYVRLPIMIRAGGVVA